MPHFTPKQLTPQSRLSAGDMNKQAEELTRLRKLDVVGGTVDNGPGAQTILLQPQRPEFWAKITDGDNNGKYAWIEQRELDDGRFEDLPLGRTGSLCRHAAFERNLNPEVPIETIVWLEMGYTGLTSDGQLDQEWIFEHCCGGGSGSGNCSGD